MEPKQTKACPRCGQKAPADADFCGACGQDIRNVGAAAEELSPPPTGPEPVPDPVSHPQPPPFSPPPMPPPAPAVPPPTFSAPPSTPPGVVVQGSQPPPTFGPPPQVPPMSQTYMSSRPHRGGLVLGLAIGGAVCCPIVSIVAAILGFQDMREIREGRMDPSGQSLTQWGTWIAIGGFVLNMMCTMGWLLLSLIPHR